jgi:hypothetical protein
MLQRVLCLGFFLPWIGLIRSNQMFTSMTDSLGLSSDSLNGTIPTELASLSNLSYLLIYNVDNLQAKFPSEFLQLSSLMEFEMSDANVGDISFSNFLSRIPRSIVSMELNSIGLQGSISHTVSEFHHLTHLKLDYLRLTGTIPTEIGLMTRLQSLGITSSSSLSGTLPSEIGRLTQLTLLDLCGVKTIVPSEVTRLSSLHSLRCIYHE